jgi:hypothetical protein
LKRVWLKGRGRWLPYAFQQAAQLARLSTSRARLSLCTSRLFFASGRLTPRQATFPLPTAPARTLFVSLPARIVNA